MEFPLAFDRDPLFSKLSEPLIKIDTRLTQKRQRFWVWKEPNFFWFWNEDELDFFGLFLEGPTSYWITNPWARNWFEEAATATRTDELRRLLRLQLHHRKWARAITVTDPRCGRDVLWRVVWRRKEFLLQNASTNRGVRFFPETHWGKDSVYWHQLNPLSHDSSFFAEVFWLLLVERRGRLATALEFLELSLEEQNHPIRFKRGERLSFERVMRAGIMVACSWDVNAPRLLVLYFESAMTQPVCEIHHELDEEISERLQRLAMTFLPYLAPGFAWHRVAPSPLMLSARSNIPMTSVRVQGPFTAHEQIEAIATVREWVFQNAPELLLDWS